tara:strand:- start:4172 stop:4867 length:696 start_codon:yes stop_codon:yes gene_type:complete
MKPIAIMQPTYLPWPGYFNLIHKSDVFIFLENTKFEKSSWQHRNYILIKEKPKLITVPVQGSRLQYIKDVKINYNTNWQKKHSVSILDNYKHHPHGMDILNVVLPIIQRDDIIYLKDLNYLLINGICKYLGIKVDFRFDSEFPTNSSKSKKILEICNFFNTRNYISPIGSKEYIEKERHLSEGNISITYQKTEFKQYYQHKISKFVPYLSILDLIANLGRKKSLEYISDNY